MNYEKMWKDLRAKIERDMEFHKSGVGQSIDESVNCAIKCKEILKYMVELEGGVMGVKDDNKLVTKKYTIDYGFGEAILCTPYPPEARFYTLANTCFGIRKSIMHCIILKTEETDCQDFERLEFNGDIYIWDSEGRRKMIEPGWAADDDWDDIFSEECKYRG